MSYFLTGFVAGQESQENQENTKLGKNQEKNQENQEKAQSAGKNEKHNQEKSNLKKLLIETPKISQFFACGRLNPKFFACGGLTQTRYAHVKNPENFRLWRTISGSLHSVAKSEKPHFSTRKTRKNEIIVARKTRKMPNHDQENQEKRI